MKNFIYLFQGTSKNISNYLHLKDRESCDVIFLTYDEKKENCEFLPNSTWAEGRNLLLKLSKKKEYLWTIFCDDDVEFVKGSWDVFEEQLMEVNPKIAVPIVPKTRKQTLSFLPYQNISVNDEQMIAFHNSVIKKEDVFPLVEKFDAIHWWASCEIQQNLIQHYYPNELIQLNKSSIDNKVTTRYESKMTYDVDFRMPVKEYLKERGASYSIKYMKNLNAIPIFIRILFRTFLFRFFTIK